MEVERISNQVTSVATASGGLGTAFGAWQLNFSEWAIVVGLALTVFFGFCNLGINYYFKYKHLQLAKDQAKT